MHVSVVSFIGMINNGWTQSSVEQRKVTVSLLWMTLIQFFRLLVATILFEQANDRWTFQAAQELRVNHPLKTGLIILNAKHGRYLHQRVLSSEVSSTSILSTLVSILKQRHETCWMINRRLWETNFLTGYYFTY